MNLKEKAKKALDKKAAYGPDLKLPDSISDRKEQPLESLENLDRRVKEVSLLSGMITDENKRSGSFYQKGDSVIYEKVQEAYGGQVEIMKMEDALETHPWLWEYWWQMVPVDMDKYTAQVELLGRGGYFIRILPSAKVDKPIQSCLLLDESGSSQRVHNLIVAEEGSQAQIITGCTISPDVKEGFHLGVSEFYVKKGAELFFTMVHNWAEDFHVRPRTGVLVEENGSFVNNYLLLNPVRTIQSYPRAVLNGHGAYARFNTIIYGQHHSVLDLGALIELNDKETRGESVSRALGTDSSNIMMRGRLKARDNSARAHLECQGMLLSGEAIMDAVPELSVEGAPKADLTHEAAVGPVDEEAVEYLMSRGFTRDEATSAILQGFMKVGIEGLPEVLEKMLEKTLKEMSEEVV
ncbi:MAG: SufD family Fe-S cluster assembly protein [Bacillota bacterium]